MIYKNGQQLSAIYFNDGAAFEVGELDWSAESIVVVMESGMYRNTPHVLVTNKAGDRMRYCLQTVEGAKLMPKEQEQ